MSLLWLARLLLCYLHSAACRATGSICRANLPRICRNFCEPLGELGTELASTFRELWADLARKLPQLGTNFSDHGGRDLFTVGWHYVASRSTPRLTCFYGIAL